jgi:hypothetical protein
MGNTEFYRYKLRSIKSDRSYITQKEVDILLTYLKENKKWDYYIIVYNLIHLQKTYVPMSKLSVNDLLIPDEIPIPDKSPFSLAITGVNQRLKVYLNECGIKDLNISSKFFSRKIIINNETVYGFIKQQKKTFDKNKDGFIYVLKYYHLQSEICKQLTDKKVGITYDLEKRVKNLTLGPIDVKVVKYWKMDYSLCMECEKILHNRLSDRRIIGEWFTDNDNSLIEIVENELIKNYGYHPE